MTSPSTTRLQLDRPYSVPASGLLRSGLRAPLDPRVRPPRWGDAARARGFLAGLCAGVALYYAPTSTSTSTAAPVAEKYEDALAGGSVTIPAGWKHGAEGGRLVLGSMTEAGLIVAWHDPDVTFEDLEREARKGIVEEGVRLAPVGPPKAVQHPAGRALSVSLQGVAPDGTELAARVVAVSRGKGAFAALALTTPEHIEALGKTLSRFAGSVRFSQPRIGDVGTLAGSMCAYSGGSGFSSTQRLNFDGKGGVTFGSEFVAGGGFKDGEGGYAGGWSMLSGNQRSAQEAGTYAISGQRVSIRFPDRALDCQVHFRQRDGRITELKCGERLWGASLCE